MKDFLKIDYLSRASRMGHWVKTLVAMSDHQNFHLRTHVVKGETAEICLLSSTHRTYDIFTHTHTHTCIHTHAHTNTPVHKTKVIIRAAIHVVTLNTVFCFSSYGEIGICVFPCI